MREIVLGPCRKTSGSAMFVAIQCATLFGCPGVVQTALPDQPPDRPLRVSIGASGTYVGLAALPCRLSSPTPKPP